MRIWWPWLLTAVILIGGIAIFWLAPDMTTRSQIGDYLAGIAGAIAFVWLIAAYLQQGSELKLQRVELSLQRAALDLQREELARLGKYAALEQIAQILNQFDLSLQKNPDAPARSANDLPAAFLNRMADWKILLESEDPNLVFESYVRWMTVYGQCLEFLERMISAVDIYGEATSQALLPTAGSSPERIYIASAKLKDIPYIRHYVGAATMLATQIVLTQPGHDRFELAGFEAIERLMPGSVKSRGTGPVACQGRGA